MSRPAAGGGEPGLEARHRAEMAVVLKTVFERLDDLSEQLARRGGGAPAGEGASERLSRVESLVALAREELAREFQGRAELTRSLQGALVQVERLSNQVGRPDLLTGRVEALESAAEQAHNRASLDAQDRADQGRALQSTMTRLEQLGDRFALVELLPRRMEILESAASRTREQLASEAQHRVDLGQALTAAHERVEELVDQVVPLDRRLASLELLSRRLEAVESLARETHEQAASEAQHRAEMGQGLKAAFERLEALTRKLGPLSTRLAALEALPARLDELESAGEQAREQAAAQARFRGEVGQILRSAFDRLDALGEQVHALSARIQRLEVRSVPWAPSPRQGAAMPASGPP